jgi:tetratricopeptide (TPR) repeat protein
VTTRRYQISNIIFAVADGDQMNGVFGPRVTGDPAARHAWWSAYDQLAHFQGDPVATLDAVNAADASFVMGPVFTLVYRLLGGVDPADPAVVVDLARLEGRAVHATEREQRHADAARTLHGGEFLAAATAWHEIAIDHPDDFPAYRFAHDVCLHIGDDDIRLPSAERAAEAFALGTREHGLSAGLLSFALEEVGRFDEAIDAGTAALAVDPDDLWARHALAHVYESLQRHDEAVELLVASSARWREQAMLSNHVWWHLGLRLLEHGDLEGALAVLDDHLTSTTAFGLSDASSLLWRLDLVSGDAVDTTGRWSVLADHWADNAQRHTCGFLDLHAALAFAAVGEHPAASAFWDGVPASHAVGDSYNDVTFRNTVVPLVAGVRAVGELDTARSCELLRGVLPTLHRIGGSVVQRDIVHRTLAAAEAAS